MPILLKFSHKISAHAPSMKSNMERQEVSYLPGKISPNCKANCTKNESKQNPLTSGFISSKVVMDFVSTNLFERCRSCREPVAPPSGNRIGKKVIFGLSKAMPFCIEIEMILVCMYIASDIQACLVVEPDWVHDRVGAFEKNMAVLTTQAILKSAEHGEQQVLEW